MEWRGWLLKLPTPAIDETELQKLSDCLAGLSPKARRILDIRYAQTQTAGEIASRIGWGLESVYVALSRARKFLRECLKRQQEIEG